MPSLLYFTSLFLYVIVCHCVLLYIVSSQLALSLCAVRR